MRQTAQSKKLHAIMEQMVAIDIHVPRVVLNRQLKPSQKGSGMFIDSTVGADGF